jgi:hypothetical protein
MQATPNASHLLASTPPCFLEPDNPAARSIVEDPGNAHLLDVSKTARSPRLGLGWHVSNKCRTTIATFGRCDCDVLLRGRSFSKLHFSFEYSETHEAIMLCDNSRYQTLEVRDIHSMVRPGSVARQRVLVPEPTCPSPSELMLVLWISKLLGFRTHQNCHWRRLYASKRLAMLALSRQTGVRNLA